MTQLPRKADVEFGEPVSRLWGERLRQAMNDSYMGVPLLKLPEDLRVYEHILWMANVSTVIELGTHLGGSALWFRDRLRTLASYGRIDVVRVVSIDLDNDRARWQLRRVDRSYAEQITLLDGDICDPGLPSRVERFVGPGAVLVVEDSAHTFETTLAGLNGFSGFVSPGSFYVAEDGCVDVEEMRVDPSFPRGVIPAVRQWLGSAQGRGFLPRPDLELYGLTCHREGYLQREG